MQVRWLDPILPPDLAIEPNFDRVIRKTNGIFGWSGEKPVENNVPAVRLQSPQITFRLGLGMSMLFVRPRGTIYSRRTMQFGDINIIRQGGYVFVAR